MGSKSGLVLLYWKIRQRSVAANWNLVNSTGTSCAWQWRTLMKLCLATDLVSPAMGNSRVHNSKSGYVIHLIAFQWDMACIHSSPDPSFVEVGQACETNTGYANLLMRRYLWHFPAILLLPEKYIVEVFYSFCSSGNSLVLLPYSRLLLELKHWQIHHDKILQFNCTALYSAVGHGLLMLVYTVHQTLLFFAEVGCACEIKPVYCKQPFQWSYHVFVI